MSNDRNSGKSSRRVVLKPGHSLMDWIKLGAANKDLSGTFGSMPEVTVEELEKHDNYSDCWICLDRKVYNVTPYLEFHPGGVDQLIQGAGRDVTELFNNIHAWVNYHGMLAKCYVGKLKPGTHARKAPVPKSEVKNNSKSSPSPSPSPSSTSKSSTVAKSS